MRVLLEIILAAGLIALGWEKPLSERAGQLPRISDKVAPSARTVKAPPPSKSATPKGAWMWDANRKTALDRPAYNQTKTFAGHITYVDEQGKSYWLDTQGKRHYEP